MDEPEPTSRKRQHHWLRALRPIFWWSILVICLFAYHTRERLSEQTRINFSVDLEGKPVGYEASATLDGRPFVSGELVSIGSHQFAVSHQKGESFATNLFIWYGEHDFGAISLKRIRGLFALETQPLASTLSVVGAEFSLTLTNSAGITSSVPTDIYRVDAHWANHDETKQITVTSGGTSALRLAPPLGAVTLESDPSGAIVIRSDGRTIGTTPLALEELGPGLWQGELRLDGYIPVPLSLSITVGETNSFRTNLVNWQYAQALESARSYLVAGDSERTLEALSAALKAKPNDPDAIALQEKATTLRQQATVAEHLQKGEQMMVAMNYPGVRSEANAVLKIVPENERAVALLNIVAVREKENLKRAQEQAEAQRQERLGLPKKTFDSALQRNPDAPLFETHELQAALPVAQVEAALRRELEMAPAFKVMRITVTAPEAFAMSAWQEVPGGSRRCLIAGAQTGDKETHIYFKVMEYKKKTSVTFQGQLTLTTSDIPLDPSRIDELTERQKTQVKEGAVILEGRIRRAIGEKNQ
jgi:tetratricopeptide (TPR) repeat protein